MHHEGQPKRPGLVHIYTGGGKGKTTAAFGLALRAVGRGLRVAVIQFMKGRPTGEVIAAEKLHPRIIIHQAGLNAMVDPAEPSPEDIAAARKGLEMARELLHDGSCDMLILDEICVAVAWNLLDTASVIELVRSRPGGVELVLTGRDADEQLIETADYVTEMRCVKHPYNKGVAAREGIEN